VLLIDHALARLPDWEIRAHVQRHLVSIGAQRRVSHVGRLPILKVIKGAARGGLRWVLVDGGT
jgi:hypothetical protein